MTDPINVLAWLYLFSMYGIHLQVDVGITFLILDISSSTAELYRGQSVISGVAQPEYTYTVYWNWTY